MNYEDKCYRTIEGKTFTQALNNNRRVRRKPVQSNFKNHT